MKETTEECKSSGYSCVRSDLGEFFQRYCEKVHCCFAVVLALALPQPCCKLGLEADVAQKSALSFSPE